MTEPDQMRAVTSRFDLYAQTVEDEARTMWTSSQNLAGNDWSGTAQVSSYNTVDQMNQTFRRAPPSVKTEATFLNMHPKKSGRY